MLKGPPDPSTFHTTWFNPAENSRQKGRIDYFLLPYSLLNCLTNAEILGENTFSDHAFITIRIDIAKVKLGPGLWQLGDAPLDENNYFKLIIDTYYETKGTYCRFLNKDFIRVCGGP